MLITSLTVATILWAWVIFAMAMITYQRTYQRILDQQAQVKLKALESTPLPKPAFDGAGILAESLARRAAQKVSMIAFCKDTLEIAQKYASKDTDQPEYWSQQATYWQEKLAYWQNIE